jgi:hypothetical protein
VTVALVGETDTAMVGGGVVPVPESATVWDVPAAVTVSVPVAVLAVTGANTT